jgi:regulatory protein YycI of two-component signal transduction system YycFG
MKDAEIKEFISSNDDENISFYLSNIIDKLKDISKENNKLGVFMTVVILLYYLIDNSIAKSINIGPISIDNLTKIQIFIPAFFAFLILRFKVINSHKAELLKFSKKITEHKFGIENSNIEPEFTDDFTRILLPLSLYEEIQKLNYKGASFIGRIGAIITLPLAIILVLIPYFFEFLWLRELYSKFSGFNVYEKATYIVTIWILIFCLYYLVHTIANSMKEQK